MSTNKSSLPPQTIITLNQPSPKPNFLSQSGIAEKARNATRPLSYTFYHPNHAQSPVNQLNPQQFQKREYRYVSHSFSSNKPPKNQPLQSIPCIGEQDEKYSNVNGYKLVSRQIIEPPLGKAQYQSVYNSTNVMANSVYSIDNQAKDYHKLRVKKISSYEQIKQIATNHLIVSTVIEQKDQQKLQDKENQSTYRANITKMQSDNHNQHTVKCDHQDLLAKCQSVEQEKEELSKKYQATQQSLKISRTIISTLNQQIARVSKESEVNIKALQQFKSQAQKQKHQIMQELSEARNAKYFFQNETLQLKQALANLQKDLICLDQENIRMDQEIRRLLHINVENEQIIEMNNTLKAQNQHLIQQTFGNLQSQNALLRASLQDQSRQLFCLQEQREKLLQQLEQKDGQIAKLNITKGSLMLQNLKLKEAMKKKENLTTTNTEQSIYLNQINHLKTEITVTKQQMELYKAQNQQKQQSLIQNSNALQKLALKLQVNDQQMQVLADDLLKTEQCIQCQKTELQQSKSNYSSLKEQFLIIQQKNKDLQQQISRLINLSSQLQKTHQQTIVQAKQALINELQQQKKTLQLQLTQRNQIIQQQRNTIEQLNNELQMQEKDYRTMVEDQINKITMIYSEQSNQLDSPIKSKPLLMSFQESITQIQLQESPRQNQNNQFEAFSKAELIEKVSELQLVNKTLKQEISNMKDLILSKYVKIQSTLEKNEQQKLQLAHKVSQLTQELQLITEKCQNYEAKIIWVDAMYKELENNLICTIEQLIKAQVSYLNCKLQLRGKAELSQTSQRKREEQENDEPTYEHEALDNCNEFRSD